MTDLERFQRFYIVDPETGCWIWQGGSVPVRRKEGGRYGMFHWNGKNGYAHRFAYEVWRGPIPEGCTTDHRCENTICCNAFHLEAVPHRVNVQRGRAQVHPIKVGAANRHCRNGHWMDEETTYHHQSGYPRCRKCAAERKRTGRPRGRPRVNNAPSLGAPEVCTPALSAAGSTAQVGSGNPGLRPHLSEAK